jgi:hypothetical protein
MLSTSISVLIFATVFAQAVPSPRLTIFVGPQVREGFHEVDKVITDSIKDIEDELRRSGLFTIATSSERAELTLVVVARHTSGTGQTVGLISPGENVAGVQQPGIQMSSLTPTTTIKGRVLETKLRVADYEKSFLSGDGSESWRYTARQVVKDVTAWVNANRHLVSAAALPPK